MDLSFENENIVSGSEDCEVFMNEMVESKDILNVQITTSRNMKL
jgi:hypothetical protein